MTTTIHTKTRKLTAQQVGELIDDTRERGERIAYVEQMLCKRMLNWLDGLGQD